MKENVLRKPVTKINLAYGLLGSFLVGLFIVKYGFYVSYLALVATICISPIILRSNAASLLAIVALGFSAGLWRGTVVQQDLNQYLPLLETKITVIGSISDDPAYNDRKQTEFHINNLILQNGNELAGKIKVGVYGGSDLRRGDLLEVTGKLYEGFGNRQGQISFGEFTAIGRKSSAVETIRQEYFAGVNSSLPEPQSSLGLGFLVGLRTILPEGLLDQLSTTGLTHIVAVSGYNLTILVRYTRKYLMRFSKFIATACSVALIIGFLMVTGLSPSIFRASIVSGFALLAWYYGRDIKPMMLILLGASITAGISPTFMWLDIGWWLSFLAFFGVLILAPLLTEKVYKKEPKFIMRTVIETTSAQFFALPLIMLIFGELSLISILANVLILPLIPLAMLLTFFAGIFGMLAPQIAGWVAWPAKILLTYMTELIALLSRAPYALTSFKLDTFGFLIVMLSLVAFTVVLARKSDKQLSGTEIIQ